MQPRCIWTFATRRLIITCTPVSWKFFSVRHHPCILLNEQFYINGSGSVSSMNLRAKYKVNQLSLTARQWFYPIRQFKIAFRLSNIHLLPCAKYTWEKIFPCVNCTLDTVFSCGKYKLDKLLEYIQVQINSIDHIYNGMSLIQTRKI